MNFNAGIGSVPIAATTYASPNSFETSNSQRETTPTVQLSSFQSTWSSMDQISFVEDLLEENSIHSEWETLLDQNDVDNLPSLYPENDQNSSELSLSEVNIDNLPLSFSYMDDVDDVNDLDLLSDPLTVTTTALPIISTLSGGPVTETAESETESAEKAKAAPLIKAHKAAVQKKTRLKKNPRVKSCDGKRKHVCRMMIINNEICGKSFDNPSDLVKHKRIHTGEKLKRLFACKECSKTFTRKEGLIAHRSIHTGEKPFSCDICNQKFRQKCGVKNHKEIKHSEERSHICTLCDARFSQKNGLTQHMQTHTGEKPYACKECPKKFTRKNGLVNHRSIHTGERLFFCDICNQTFRLKDGLKMHKKAKHTEKKSHMCTLCNAGFPKKFGLINHIRTHTGEKPYVCNICKKRFSQLCSLLRHRKNIHQIESTVTQTEVLTQT